MNHPIHTPGPYPLDYEYEANGNIVIRTAQGNFYARTYDPQAARMIVAGPEMLEALIECHSSLSSHYTDGHGYTLDQKRMLQASIAITKALGQSA